MPENVEMWKQIDGFGGRYFVSNMGRVYSDGSNGGREGIVRPERINSGYMKLMLCCDGKPVGKLVHRLVADAFCPGHSTDRNFVNHINGDKCDNRARNLEWVTRAENMSHAVNVLGHKTKKGCKQLKQRKLTPEQVRAIRKDPRPCHMVAKDYGVGHSTVSNARNRVGWFADIA